MTDLALDEEETNDEQIKITWTNPSPAPTELVVAFDSYRTPATDPDSTEFVLTDSASGVPFTPGQSGKCKVITVADGDCDGEESEVEIDCAASVTSRDAKKYIAFEIFATNNQKDFIF